MKLLLQVAVLSLFFIRAMLVSPELHHPMFLPPLRHEGPVHMSSTHLQSWHEQLWGQTCQKQSKGERVCFRSQFQGTQPIRVAGAVLALWWRELATWFDCIPAGVESRGTGRSRTGVKPSMRASGGPYQPVRVYVSKILFVTSEKKSHQLGTKCLKMSPWG